MAPRAMPRTPHSSLNARNPSPRRVPPAQSTTRPAAACTAASGSRDDSSRVTRVSRVPSANASTRVRLTTAACTNRTNARAYGSMEPLTSSSSTSGRGRVPVVWYAGGATSPAARSDRRTVRRMSGRPWMRDDGRRRRDGRLAPVTRRSAINRRAWANSAGVYDAKSRSRSVSTGLHRTVTAGRRSEPSPSDASGSRSTSNAAVGTGAG